jgi:AraC-like DNA-binding protein
LNERNRVAVERIAGDGRSAERATRAPRAALRPFVRGLAGFDERAAAGREQREFPVSSLVVIIEFGPPLLVTPAGDVRRAARHGSGFAVGFGEEFALVGFGPRQRGVQVDLTPTGARRLFGLPLAEFAGRIAPLSELWGRDAARLAEQLDGAPGWAERFDRVEDLLEARIVRSRLDTARVDWALGRIESTGGALAIGALARELGHSRKHLVTLFRDQVGVPPKLFARLVRFERTLQSASMPAPQPWAELALAHGYADQAHLARELRRFTGLTPTQARVSHAELAPLFG